jgi:methylmalonyl-CoA mutase cobalamin-binding subunit
MKIRETKNSVLLTKKLPKGGGHYYVVMGGNIVVLEKRMFFDKNKAMNVAAMMIAAIGDNIKKAKTDVEKADSERAQASIRVLPLRIM